MGAAGGGPWRREEVMGPQMGGGSRACVEQPEEAGRWWGESCGTGPIRGGDAAPAVGEP